MAEVSFSLPAKRKRGRPRKDGNIFRQGCLQSPENHTPVKTQHAEVAYPTPDGTVKTHEADIISEDGFTDGMVGSMIYGVIEGSFDAGYFISVRIGTSSTPLRGVVFQPRKIVPITAANDVARHAKMYQRRDMPVPVYEDFGQIGGIISQHEEMPLHPVQVSKEPALSPILPSMSLSATPYSMGNHSTFMAEPTIMRTSSCSNMGATAVTIPKSPINQQSTSIQTGSSIGMLERHSEGSKKNVASMADMISGSSVNPTSNSFSGSENIDQKHEVLEKTAELGPGQSFLAHNRQSTSNVELHLNSMEGVHQAAYGIREMDTREFVHDREQSPTVELKEIPAAAQVHSVPREPEATKTELRPADLYYSGLRTTDVNFPQYILADQSQPNSQHPRLSDANFHPGDFVGIPKSPNLKLDLSSAMHEKKTLQLEPEVGDKTSIETNYFALKNPNVGYHQALVSGNPLLLPPDIGSTSPDFMLERHKSLSHNRTQETNLELESGFTRTSESFHVTGGTGNSMHNAEVGPPSAAYKLELAAPKSNMSISSGKQTTTSSGCMTTYMDFVLGDVVKPRQPHGQQSDLTETMHR